MNDELKKRMRGVAVLAAAGLAAGTIGVTVLPNMASAQELPVPTASAEAACVEGVGAIRVTIFDEEPYDYDVFIDEVLVDEEITDTDETFIEYGPFEDGVYNVAVGWYQGERLILDTDVTVDCTADVTTTVAPTTTVQVAAATATAPTFTG